MQKVTIIDTVKMLFLASFKFLKLAHNINLLIEPALFKLR